MNKNISPIVVVDVGARSGVQETWKNTLYPVRVFGFEPDSEECDALNASCTYGEGSLSDSVSVRYFPWALAESRSKRVLYLYKDRRLSSFYLPNEAFLSQFPIERLLSRNAFSVDAKAELDCISLDQFCQGEKIGCVDFIKLDTQGSELEILRGADKTLDGVFGIAVEVEFSPIYKDQPLFGEVDAYLKSKGFSLFDLNRHWWKRTSEVGVESRGQVMFADAIYFRDPALPDAHSHYWESLKKDTCRVERIVALASVLGYSDFALTLLNYLVNSGCIDNKMYEVLKIKHVRFQKYSSKNKHSNALWARFMARLRGSVNRWLAKIFGVMHKRHLHVHHYDNDERRGLR